VIPHEDRRELRGERLLAAWTNHWDARSPNTLDTFVHATGGGYVRHWLLDFGDLFGVLEDQDARSRRLGHTSILHPGRVAVDFVGLGLVRRPWDSGTIDPRFVDLGYYGVTSFDPESWEPLIPSSRYAAATVQDMGWMARKIARVTEAHLRATVAVGQFSDPAVAERLVDVLLARRARILRWAFERTSPLGELRVEGERLCAVDLALLGGVSTEAATAYTTEYRVGEGATPLAMSPALTRGARPHEFCFRLPPHFAPAAAADDAPARYATLEITRTEGGAHPRLRAHFYDLGPARGFALVGVER
jgi:hypothetical protein